jgi:hypothetical protein
MCLGADKSPPQRPKRHRAKRAGHSASGPPATIPLSVLPQIFEKAFLLELIISKFGI